MRISTQISITALHILRNRSHHHSGLRFVAFLATGHYLNQWCRNDCVKISNILSEINAPYMSLYKMSHFCSYPRRPNQISYQFIKHINQIYYHIRESPNLEYALLCISTHFGPVLLNGIKIGRYNEKVVYKTTIFGSGLDVFKPELLLCLFEYFCHSSTCMNIKPVYPQYCLHINSLRQRDAICRQQS